MGRGGLSIGIHIHILSGMLVYDMDPIHIIKIWENWYTLNTENLILEKPQLAWGSHLVSCQMNTYLKFTIDQKMMKNISSLSWWSRGVFFSLRWTIVCFRSRVIFLWVRDNREEIWGVKAWKIRDQICPLIDGSKISQGDVNCLFRWS